MGGDGPGLLEWIGDTSGAVSIELIFDGQKCSRAEGYGPRDYRVRIGDVKVNERRCAAECTGALRNAPGRLSKTCPDLTSVRIYKKLANFV